ncbi:Phosphoribosyl 1,2-cyclic phosphate 1,2-diphosphodiesterase [Paenibacillus allorhizoplanae]|uniref:Phosphoribosyl 1,2-cyclic phosphate 1,2-diphosphodiesterase n=1 Tax=Paenibacillus allorhizoplanae TaxID=2905648 RepID=A0ABN8FYJ0_9BACL|nr:PHP domain-containing protein [Paenibacillus allorhizoplanae]CAH1193169.1 Phosphoribosyl 1,2-cyclic phosphate 1,2-diphosphodiesterase [Paenibacillus allorhizoplanae]
MKYNYHMHSCYSDGTNTPEELIGLAIEHGIQSVALTDHDTVEGVEAFMAAAEGTDIKTLPGVEISSCMGPKIVHILGYGIDIKNAELLKLLNSLTAEASEYTKYTFEKYVSKKFDYSWEQVLRHNQNRKGFYLSSLFYAMLQDGRFNGWDQYRDFVAYCFHFSGQSYGAPIEKSFEVIKKSGGKAFLAHPKLMKLSLDEEYKIFKQMKVLGLDGIEAYYPAHSPKESNWYELCCERLGLEVSGGTDWHGMARLNTPLYVDGNIQMN